MSGKGLDGMIKCKFFRSEHNADGGNGGRSDSDYTRNAWKIVEGEEPILRNKKVLYERMVVQAWYGMALKHAH